MRDIDYKKTILPNGLRLITAFKDSDIFSIGAGINAGSLYEEQSESGISHLVEHMLFKGTASRDMEKLNSDIERLAGDIDIYTTYNQTVMNASTMKNHGEECMKVISDMLMNASFPEKEFHLEKKVIEEEIKMGKDDLEDMSYLRLYMAAFPTTWYKYHITGTTKSVKSIKLEDLRKFYNEYYNPNNTVVCVVSSFNHDEVLNMALRCFGEWRVGSKAELGFPREVIVPGKTVSHRKGIGQAHVLYGFDISCLDRKGEVALALLNKKLGSGANSLLFRELRDRKGYAYNIYSDIDFVKCIKMLYIYAAVSNENMKDVTSIIDNTVERFAGGDIFCSEDGVEILKDIFRTDTSIAVESGPHLIDYMLDGELGYNDPMEYKNVLEIMEGISLEDMKNTAALVLKNPIIHILSPS